MTEELIQKTLGIGGHHRPYRGSTDEWLTPPELLGRLGEFDLDPCAAVKQPWPTAKKHLTVIENGLSMPWAGRVWCNPPYGPATGTWLSRLASHTNGIALIFARTETEMFHREVWERADACLFLEGRLYFYRLDGTRAKANAGGPSVLIAYGAENVQALAESGIKGALVRLDQIREGRKH